MPDANTKGAPVSRNVLYSCGRMTSPKARLSIRDNWPGRFRMISKRRTNASAALKTAAANAVFKYKIATGIHSELR